MGPAPPGGPLVDIGEPMMSHGNTVRSIGGRQDPNRGLAVGQLEHRIDEIRTDLEQVNLELANAREAVQVSRGTRRIR